MFRGTGSNLYRAAFNPHAKARANWGLKGVGLYTSKNVYTREGQGLISVLLGFGSFWTYTQFIFTADDASNFIHSGGGPVPFPLSAYGYPADFKEKPWELTFAPGEGFENGPAILRPAEGAPEHCTCWDGHH